MRLQSVEIRTLDNGLPDARDGLFSSELVEVRIQVLVDPSDRKPTDIMQPSPGIRELLRAIADAE